MANIPANAQELFNVQVPQALKEHPDKAKEINAVFLFKITGDDPGVWTVDLAAATPSCTEGDKGNSQCAIEITHADFKTMLQNPGNPQIGMQLFFQGKLKVTGDTMLATKLQKLFSMGGPAA